MAKTKTIYTVSSFDDGDNGWERLVVGSYVSRGRAIDDCVDYILQRLDVRDDLAWAMANDDNHPEAKEFFAKEDGYYVVKDADGLRAYVRDELGGQGCYYACTFDSSFHFDVDENDLVG